MFYRALFGRYLQQGIAERDARQKAYAEVRGYLGKGSLSPVRQLSAPSGQNGHSGQESGQHPNGQNGRNGQVKARVHAYLDSNPGLAQLSVNQVLAAMKEADVRAGRTTVADVLQERKAVKVNIPV